MLLETDFERPVPVYRATQEPLFFTCGSSRGTYGFGNGASHRVRGAGEEKCSSAVATP